jgi:tRNA pseudouridine38-40 synthase
MAEAAALLRGKHCFRAFHDAGSPPRDTRRTLFDLSLHQFDAEDVWSFMCPGPRAGLRGLPFLVITLVADGFLYHMARVLVGTLLEVGRGALSPQSVAERLADGRRDLAGPTAPPRGLWLDAVLYADDPRTWFYLDTVRVVQ